MYDDEVMGGIRVSFVRGLKPWNDQPPSYSHFVTIRIVADRDDKDDPDATEPAGRIAATVVNYSEAFNDDVDMEDIFFEANLGDIYSAVFKRSGELRRPIDATPLPGDIIFIESITLRPKFRQTRLLLQAVETLIPSLSSLCIVLARRSTLDHGKEEWRELGFTALAGTDLVYRDNCEIGPRMRAY